MRTRKIHIIVDIVTMWTFVVLAIYLGIAVSKIYIFFAFPLVIWFFVRTLKWLRIAFDVFFSTPLTISTKGFRFSYRDRIYALDITKTLFYSVVMFDDAKLKGKYVYLETAMFCHGEILEITYYPKSKYIKSIKKLQN